MKKRGSMQIAGLMAQLSHLPDRTRQFLVPTMQRQGRLLVSSTGNTKGLVQATPPYMLNSTGGAGNSAAFQRGKKAVARDIRRVYGTPGTLFTRIRDRDPDAANQFWKLFKLRKLTAASDLAERITGYRLQVFDDGEQHKERRDSRGRIWGKRQSLYVYNPKWIKDYVKIKQANVGLLASAMVAPAEARFGPVSGVPEWVRRHAAPWGSVQLMENGGNVTVQASIAAPYGGLELQRLFTYVLEFRVRAFRRELPYLLRAAVKDAGFV